MKKVHVHFSPMICCPNCGELIDDKVFCEEAIIEAINDAGVEIYCHDCGETFALEVELMAD